MTSAPLRNRGALLRSGVLFIFVVGFSLFAEGSAFAEASSGSDPSICGPFDEQDANVVRLAANFQNAERGVSSPAASAAGATRGAPSGPGNILSLPTPGTNPGTARAGASAASAQNGAGAPSEALLALPKDGSGNLPSDFELGQGATIAESFFSPVICATVARVTGPPGASMNELVTVVPESSLVVANDVYASAAADIGTTLGGSGRPDPYTSLQYGLAVSGVREARGLSKGEGVRIALLDSAPESNHADLAATRIRFDEGPPTAPASSREAVPTGVHGTLMAGVLGAVEGNGFGIAGLAPASELVSIPVCTPEGPAGGRCTIYHLLQGLDQAYRSESQLVNLSLSGPPNPLLERGVARLEQLGLVVVAAAGNEGTEDKRYPAAYPSVVGVGAMDREGEAFALSNQGSWVEIYAPGVEVLSTIPGDAFAFGNGTSLAAAHVTGALAVITRLTGDPRLARAEFFRAAETAGGLRRMPPVCDVFRRLGVECETDVEGRTAR
ncbi:MAG: S8 family serine peptidase [Myxococcota bacterium]